MLLGNLEETTKVEENPVESKFDEAQLVALRILYKRWDEIKARDGIPPIAVDRTNSYHGQYIKTPTDLDMVWKEIVALRKTMGLESNNRNGRERTCRCLTTGRHQVQTEEAMNNLKKLQLTELENLVEEAARIFARDGNCAQWRYLMKEVEKMKDAMGWNR
ncbi:hypothetical protein BTUL_0175g00200 [Botrytis tulipae]|uniref:Uncharacterized protein n=1 Tax=Botrytis tulipae TaxID=87230 RepID=A0A4Z1EFK4_9HELO|nr:hypothetical protein BTUL_0175g00200 [Botrytis tulipae]